MLKRTPLRSAHERAGAKLIEFGGWEMPVHYSSITDEHLAVRRAAGLFDISHMGEVQVRGAMAATFLNRLLTNDIGKLTPGHGQYTLLCNHEGGVIDDLYAYRIAEREYFLIINASRIDVDFAWMQKELERMGYGNEIELRNMSDAYGAIALQGPASAEILQRCVGGTSCGGLSGVQISALRKNQIGVWDTADCGLLLAARTGYTGEDGFEIVTRAESVECAWERFLSEGLPLGCKPAGLGARDTLRTEMGYPLYGHELNEQVTPIEASLGFFVALNKGEFNGGSVLARQKAEGTTRKCVTFCMDGKTAPPRPHYPIWTDADSAQPTGEVTSGTQSPSLEIGIGMGFVPVAMAQPGTRIQVEVRGKRWPAVVAKKPVYVRPTSAV
ncbi:MAG: glycine cleavage system aminomethyltransferase GcvT [Verrucomicrobia bacterium]|nr:glycine cleavage system aminomethyltransferase GcvT [Verrucomicrobiota bacterium]